MAEPGRSQRRPAATQLILARAAGREIVAAFGDTAGDIPLLALARRAMAVAPDAILRRAAVERGCEILEDV
jgi:phosphoserine phosphatase